MQRTQIQRNRYLRQENLRLRTQLAEAEQLLNAIHNGHVDALLVNGANGPQVYTLHSVERIYRVLVETMNEGAVTLNPEGAILYANQYLLNLLGTTPDQLIGTTFTHVVAEAQRPALQQLFALALQAPCAGGSVLIHSDGEAIPIHLALNPLHEGGVPTICGIIVDMRDYERSQAALRSALAEKEVLLREIHHRVKNNLQVISSLLRLQSRTLNDSRIKSAFQDSLSRIRAMALVHEQLYAGSDLAHVDAREYLKSLTNSILRGSTTDHIYFQYNCDPQIVLSIDISVPLGLIVSELMLNSLHHAFPNNQPGTLCVCLKRNAEQLELIVTDNGVGLPDTFENAQTLGLRIIHTLVHQLNAKIMIESQGGTCVTIIVPLRDHESTTVGET